MQDDDNKRNFRQECISNIDDCSAMIYAWKEVQFVNKKDGTPYKNAAKAIRGKDVEVYTSPYNSSITVTAYVNGRDIKDSLSITEYYSTSLNRYIVMSVPEIKDEINKRIDYLSKEIERNKKILGKVNELEQLYADYDNIVARVRKISDGDRSLKYEIKDDFAKKLESLYGD